MRSLFSIRGCIRPSVHPCMPHQLNFWEIVFLIGTRIKEHREYETMPFKRRFRDKYAGRSPERICCPNSVRLVFLPLVSAFSLLARFSAFLPSGFICYCRIFRYWRIRYCWKKIKEKKSGPTTPIRYCRTSGTVGSGIAKFNCTNLSNSI